MPPTMEAFRVRDAMGRESWVQREVFPHRNHAGEPLCECGEPESWHVISGHCAACSCAQFTPPGTPEGYPMGAGCYGHRLDAELMEVLR